MSSYIPKGSPIRSKERFIIFGAPLIGDNEINEVVASMKTGWLGTGPKVNQFEQDIKQYKGSNHAVAVNSCTAGLHLSLLASNLKPGDEVITTPMTFCATVNSIIHAGGTPVLADIDPLTLNIDPAEIRKKITKNTRAILPVHFAGYPCEMDEIVDIAREHNLTLIEDCAHAIETEYKGRKAGTFGEFGCLSFYVTKNIVTGEGGMVITDNDELAARIKVLALHGMSKDAWKRFGDEGFKHYQVVEAGFKYNMMDLQAAIGLHQLKNIDTFWLRRQEIWSTYTKAFSDLPITTPADYNGDGRHAYHLYTIQVSKETTGVGRDYFLDAITREGIGVGVHYLSIPEHPYYQKTFGWRPEDYPHATRIGRSTLSLPISPKLSEEDVNDVIHAVNRIISSI